jgi:hypothetical protein
MFIIHWPVISIHIIIKLPLIPGRLGKECWYIQYLFLHASTRFLEIDLPTFSKWVSVNKIEGKENVV